MRSEFIEKPLYNRVFEYMQFDNALAMQVALETGLRIDDVLSLRLENLIGNKIECVAKKTGKIACRNIPTHIKKLLIKNSGNGWLFPSPKNKVSHKTRQAVWKDVRKACEKAGIFQHVTPHSSRKTFAVNLMREHGVTSVQKALQHDNVETTMLYAFSDLMSGKRQKSVNFDIDIDTLANIVAEKVFNKIVKYLNV